MKKLILFVALSIITLPLAVSVLTEDRIASIERQKAYQMEIKCMASTLYYESNSEPIEGVRAVYEVVRNRAHKNKTSWCAEIKKKFQFSYLNSGKIKLDTPITPREKELFDSVKALDNILEYDTMFYHAAYVKPAWSKKMVIDKRIGQHIFYKLKEKR